ncbi:hypothetical protein LAZ67_1003116 [Cordylochernes scorpioides]|uniref:HTH CENPB-type domain-containing protein n=1 Tax=Cordylochernes scorpioides TaxID=51811 RepID=A0ABY6JZD8_9ARAC|nr:hypothetical protein LAZ67_1003116 [Cordylochernes scorpioides]
MPWIVGADVSRYCRVGYSTPQRGRRRWATPCQNPKAESKEAGNDLPGSSSSLDDDGLGHDRAAGEGTVEKLMDIINSSEPVIWPTTISSPLPTTTPPVGTTSTSSTTAPGTIATWFKQARSAALPVNGPLLSEKAKTLALEFGLKDFTGSGGWIERWKARHGIKLLSDVEIVESILQAKEEEETDQVDEEVDPIVHIPHPKEVLESIQTLRLFLQCQDESKSLHRHLSDLDNIEKSVQHLLLTSKCQKKITNYFSKNT